MIKKLSLKTMVKSIIFDLDDTLFYELDYLKSGFSSVARKISNEQGISRQDIQELLIETYFLNLNPFKEMINRFNLKYSVEYCLNIYRTHIPKIKLSPSASVMLEELLDQKFNLGLLTDGRSIQQRNKIKSLKLEKYFKHIIISEEFGSMKPAKKNYIYFSKIAFSDSRIFYFVGDNIDKDFYTPNKLGWTTICLKDKGFNIHKQNFDKSSDYIPMYTVKDYDEILNIIID